MEFTFSSPGSLTSWKLPKEDQINTQDTITIRPAGPEDRTALDRLAGRDSATLPDDDFLVAEVAGEAWAAIGIRTHALVADPFRPSGQVAELLRMRIDRGGGGAFPADAVAPFRRLPHRPAPESLACS